MGRMRMLGPRRSTREWGNDEITLTAAQIATACRVCARGFLPGDPVLHRSWGDQGYAHPACGYWRSGDAPSDVSRIGATWEARAAMAKARGEPAPPPPSAEPVRSILVAPPAPLSPRTRAQLVAMRLRFSAAMVRPLPATEEGGRAELARMRSAAASPVTSMFWRSVRNWLEGA